MRVKFTTILPGFIDTDFITAAKYPMVISLEYASNRIFRAIIKEKKSKIIDWKWAIVVLFWRLIPKFIWRRVTLF